MNKTTIQLLRKLRRQKLQNCRKINVVINQQKLLLIGCDHTNINKRDLKNNFDGFIKDTDHSKIIAITEGDIPADEQNKTHIIKKYRESGWLYLLAQRLEIKTVSVETTPDKLITGATILSNKINIISWIILNILFNNLQNHKLNSRITNSLDQQIAMINHSLKILKNQTLNYPIIASHINRINNQNLLPTNLAELNSHKFNTKRLKKAENSFIKNTVINQAGADINLIREYYMAKNIISLIKNKKHVIGFIGLNHLPTIKTIIKAV